MKFPLEKILTISARDYCEMNGKYLVDYTAKGIHVNEHDYKVMESFLKQIPADAEVVVEYRAAGGNRWAWANGTALIPRNP